MTKLLEIATQRDEAVESEIDWRHGWDEEQINGLLHGYHARNLSYGNGRILGFPGTTPHSILKSMPAAFIMGHANNIGLHSNSPKSEHGFVGTQDAERRVIAMCAELIGAKPSEVDGYIASGGTEANIVGCWIGRNGHAGKTAIVSSFLAHYSFAKAANLLGIGNSPNTDGSGYHLLGTDGDGHLLLVLLERKLSELARKEVKNVIVIGNAGTTMLGSVDNIAGMSEVLMRFERKFACLHFHVDAAFGGLLAPFLGHSIYCKMVDTITLDLHKIGLAPYGSGIIIARRGMFERVRTIAPYVPGDDSTLSGSRSGLIALQCLAVMLSMGIEGYREQAERLTALAGKIRERFLSEGLDALKNDMNVVAVRGRYPQSLFDLGYLTHVNDRFPANMVNASNENSVSKRDQTSVWNVVVMPHTTMELIDAFLEAHKKAW